MAITSMGVGMSSQMCCQMDNYADHGLWQSNRLPKSENNILEMTVAVLGFRDNSESIDIHFFRKI